MDGKRKGLGVVRFTAGGETEVAAATTPWSESNDFESFSGPTAYHAPAGSRPHRLGGGPILYQRSASPSAPAVKAVVRVAKPLIWTQQYSPSAGTDWNTPAPTPAESERSIVTVVV